MNEPVSKLADLVSQLKGLISQIEAEMGTSEVPEVEMEPEGEPMAGGSASDIMRNAMSKQTGGYIK